MTFTAKLIVNFCNFYELKLWKYKVGTDFTLGKSLIGTVKLTENADPDKYSYSGYGIGFNSHRFISFPNISGKCSRLS